VFADDLNIWKFLRTVLKVSSGRILILFMEGVQVQSSVGLGGVVAHAETCPADQKIRNPGATGPAHPSDLVFPRSAKFFDCLTFVERETGIEPATSSLGSWHSTAELLPLASICFETSPLVDYFGPNKAKSNI
jgi:hypothetical protein